MAVVLMGGLAGCSDGPNAKPCQQGQRLMKWVADTRGSYGAVPEVRVTQFNAVGKQFTTIAGQAKGDVKTALQDLATTLSSAGVDGQTAFTQRGHALDGTEAQVAAQAAKLHDVCD